MNKKLFYIFIFLLICNIFQQPINGSHYRKRQREFSRIQRIHRERSQGQKIDLDYFLFQSAKGNLSDENIIKKLIEKGAGYSYQDDNKRNVLHIATIQGNTQLIKELHKKNTKSFEKNIIQYDNNHTPPLFYALAQGNDEISNFLLKIYEKIENKNKFSSLYSLEKHPHFFRNIFSTAQPNLNFLSFIMRNGFNPNTQDGNGDTLLHYAAMNNNPELIKALQPFDVYPDEEGNYSEETLNPFIKNNMSISPFEEACTRNNFEFINIFLQNFDTSHEQITSAIKKRIDSQEKYEKFYFSAKRKDFTHILNYLETDYRKIKGHYAVDIINQPPQYNSLGKNNPFR